MAQEIKMSAAGLKAVQDELEYLKTVMGLTEFTFTP